jgi:PAS domain-containing protein
VDKQAAVPPAHHEVVRLRLLSLTDALTDADALEVMLRQAVAGLGGIAAMVHRLDDDGLLRLAAVSGRQEEAAAWERIAGDVPVAPARAVRDGGFAWTRLRERAGAGSTPSGPEAVAAEPGSTVGQAVPGGRAGAAGAPAGLAAVAVPGPDRPWGAVSVLTAGDVAPSRHEQEFLYAAAQAIAPRLAHAVFPLTTSASRRPGRAAAAGHGASLTTDVGAWEWDMRAGTLLADDRALSTWGITSAEFDGKVESWAFLIHPDDVEAVFTELGRAIIERDAFTLRHRVGRPDGRQAWVESRGHVVFGDGDAPLLIRGTAEESTAARTAHASISEALQLHPSDRFIVVDSRWRITYRSDEAARAHGTADDLVGQVLWDAVPGLDPSLLLQGHDQLRREAAASPEPGAARALWHDVRLLPLPTGAVVHFIDVTEQRVDDAGGTWAARPGTQRTTRVTELTEDLAQAVTMSDVVQAMVDRVMPPVDATGLLVSILEGTRIRLAGSVGYSPEFIGRLDGMELENAPPVAEVLTTHIPRFISTPQEYLDLYPLNTALRAAGGKQAWAFLPLVVSGRAVGCCVLSFDTPRMLDEEERALLIAVSGLVAHALERARLYDVEHARAKALQRELLPRSLPLLHTVLSAARYLPATADVDVGGDWYDVIPLSCERVALVIGDVMGHGLSEAVIMGRLRTAVYTLADLEIFPDEILARLDTMVAALGDDVYATCLYAVYDPATCVLSITDAGHPPPAIVHPDGSVHIPDISPDPPLGAASPPFGTVDIAVPQGSLIVFYTDGLVESEGIGLDEGIDRLAQALRTAPSRARNRTDDRGLAGHTDRAADSIRLEHLCDHLTSVLRPGGERANDDTAMLVTRTYGIAGEDIVSWPLPEDAVAAGQARRLATGQLAQWGLDDLAMTTELVVSELVGNVVRHAKGPIALRLMRGSTLICEVTDGSETTPRIRHAATTDEGGRGLQLVAALSNRWGSRYTPTGKSIWAEQLLPE